MNTTPLLGLNVPRLPPSSGFHICLAAVSWVALRVRPLPCPKPQAFNTLYSLSSPAAAAAAVVAVAVAVTTKA